MTVPPKPGCLIGHQDASHHTTPHQAKGAQDCVMVLTSSFGTLKHFSPIKCALRLEHKKDTTLKYQNVRLTKERLRQHMGTTGAGLPCSKRHSYWSLVTYNHASAPAVVSPGARKGRVKPSKAWQVAKFLVACSNLCFPSGKPEAA